MWCDVHWQHILGCEIDFHLLQLAWHTAHYSHWCKTALSLGNFFQVPIKNLTTDGTGLGPFYWAIIGQNVPETYSTGRRLTARNKRSYMIMQGKICNSRTIFMNKVRPEFTRDKGDLLRILQRKKQECMKVLNRDSRQWIKLLYLLFYQWGRV